MHQSVMPYLIFKDYQTNIQDRNYIQLVQNSDSKRVAAEQWAISIVRGRLTQKYDVTKEFTDTLPFDPTKQYSVRDRVVIDYPKWVASSSYSLQNCIIYNGIGYICTTANSDATFISANWSSLGAQYTIYYASYPSTCTYQGLPNPATLANPYAPEFALIDVAMNGDQNVYQVGDIVYYKGYTYSCVTATQLITDNMVIQYNYYKDVPYINVLPDDMVNNAQNQFWGNKTAYVIPVGTLPTNTAFWTDGDNRTPEITECVKDITIWKLSALVYARCEKWDNAYNSALAQLKCYANGDATLLMPRLLIPRGSRTRSGGHTKQNNTYAPI